ncbi:nuclear transcription factor Y, gamma [Nematocida homosporus]|uniref:nuclear transcription factor Y, gamma n=1 Tax=Nematocida homosporus TaxID=1912981 RepID=UPI00221E5F0A|nr:nuclear transcription factor Y, gamma [Nematocida homosporus]KAI5184533.1 nuclear transcription factor Y, gamma [Nematocida homosporus]
MKKNGVIEEYWKNVLGYVSSGEGVQKDNALPLARIKRLMKVEQEVSKVASEVPLLFSRVTEIFIEELTLRAWQHTEEGKRRILQRSDICSAIKSSDLFDFLIYLMPRGSGIIETSAHPKYKY